MLQSSAKRIQATGDDKIDGTYKEVDGTPITTIDPAPTYVTQLKIESKVQELGFPPIPVKGKYVAFTVRLRALLNRSLSLEHQDRKKPNDKTRVSKGNEEDDSGHCDHETYFHNRHAFNPKFSGDVESRTGVGAVQWWVPSTRPKCPK